MLLIAIRTHVWKDGEKLLGKRNNLVAYPLDDEGDEVETL